MHQSKLRFIAIMSVVIIFETTLVFSTRLYPRTDVVAHIHKMTKMFYNYSSNREKSFMSEQCRYPFYIFIHPLPAIFNMQVIVNLESLVRNSSDCPAKYSTTAETLIEGTCPLLQFNTEILIHRLLAEHPCVTSDPSKAIFFYLPVYAYYMHSIARKKQMEATFREPLELFNQMLLNSSNVDAFYQYADRQATLDMEQALSKTSQFNSNTLRTEDSQIYSSPVQQIRTLPSFYKPYLHRNKLCDHIFVASRPFYSWDGRYIWQANRGRGYGHQRWAIQRDCPAAPRARGPAG